MRPREPVFIEILNGLPSWWSNWLKMRNWYVISSLPLHFILHSWYPMVGINYLTLPLKFGVLRRNIHEDIQQAILAARFLSKNSPKKRTTCLFLTFQCSPPHIWGVIWKLQLGWSYLCFKMWGECSIYQGIGGTSAWSISVPSFWSKNRSRKANYIQSHLSASIH